MSALTLLGARRFGAFFWAQFLGAFNDNLFRNALVVFTTFRAVSVLGLPSEQVVTLSGGVFTLPFFLFSATAGQLADKLPKHRLLRWVKAFEIPTMAFAAGAIWLESGALMLCALFLTGLQAAFFGPVKYGVLPQLLDEDDLVTGNALVETGTSLAILLGTICGGLLLGLGDSGPGWVAACVVSLAACGWLASLAVPVVPAESPGLRIARNPFAPLAETLAITRANRAVFLSVLAISWFWFFGAAFLSLLPTYTRDVLGGGEGVITFFLALFCVGIGVGSLACERLSGRRVELGLVPLGSIGMSLFVLDLFFASPHPVTAGGELRVLRDVLAAPHGVRIALDLLLIAASSGVFVVPLYALVQQRSDPSRRSRVIAGSNILGAAFMVASALETTALLKLGVSVPWILFVLGVQNALVAIYVYGVIPEFLFRFVAWILANVLYRLHYTGRENIPQRGPALLVANHVTFIDWLFIASVCKRPARFVMHQDFLAIPGLGFVFRDAKVIPIASARENAETLDAAFDRIAEELGHNHVVCIFPEGRLTGDGRMSPFRPGVERIVARTPVPVVPIGLRGLWGSFFSRKHGHAMRRPFRRFWSRIDLAIGEPVPPERVRADDLARRVAALAELEPPAPLQSRPQATTS
ncbi:MAG TPA: MFS transporter [Myxococcota bacterium]|nr:MFS transporter [Myxococcota bacterium]